MTDYVKLNDCHAHHMKLHGSIKLMQGQLAIILMILIPMFVILLRALAAQGVHLLALIR